MGNYIFFKYSNIFIILILLVSCSITTVKPNLVQQQKLKNLIQIQNNISQWNIEGRIGVDYKKKYSQIKYYWINKQNFHRIEVTDLVGRSLVRIEGNIDNFKIQYYQKDLKGNRFFSYLKSYLPLLYYWLRNIPSPNLDLDLYKFENNQLALLKQEDWDIRFLKYTKKDTRNQFFSKLMTVTNLNLEAKARVLISKVEFTRNDT